jgi:hypothetical protein
MLFKDSQLTCDHETDKALMVYRLPRLACVLLQQSGRLPTALKPVRDGLYACHACLRISSSWQQQ